MAVMNKGLAVGMNAPQWGLKTVEGRRITLDQFKGRPLLLFFFRGTWCPNCRRQMESIAQEWKRVEPLASVVGIVGQTTEGVSDYLARNPLPYPLLADPDRTVIKAYGVYQLFGPNGFRIAYPSTVLIDSRGVVQYCYVGESQFDRPDLDSIIKEVRSLSSPISA